MTSLDSPRRVVALISGAGSTMSHVIDAAADAAYGARVVAVISDRGDAAGLDIAREAGIATAVVSPSDFADRHEWNSGLVKAIETFSPDIVACLGFMRILGPAVIAAFPQRIINTHPALLPAYPGAHGVRDALANGAKVTGCTMHFVDAGVDTGPIIAQRALPVEDGDTEDSLHERIKLVERALVADTLGALAREGWNVDGRRVRVGPMKGEA